MRNGKQNRMDTLELIYQDSALVAVNKPAGLLVHRSRIDRHETRFALQLLRDQLGRRVYPVHRLDKPTSGVLLFCLTPEAAHAVAAQFEARQVSKRYLAVVRGHAPASGIIDYALKRKHDTLAHGETPREHPVQEAVTRFHRLATAEIPVAVDRYPSSRYSLLELQPETGRRHQLRRHMKHIGYPLIGDAKYGKGVHNRFFQREFDCARLLLACVRMELTHPLTGRRLSISAGLEASWSRVASAFGWHDHIPEYFTALVPADGDGYTESRPERVIYHEST